MLIMVQSKLLRPLGYFPMLVDVPLVLIDHIRTAMRARPLSRTAIARYEVSGSRIRHQKLLRGWLDIRATRCRHPVHKDGEDRSQYFISHSPRGAWAARRPDQSPHAGLPLWPPLFLFPHRWRKGDSYQQSFRPDEATDGLAPRLIPVPDQHPIPS